MVGETAPRHRSSFSVASEPCRLDENQRKRRTGPGRRGEGKPETFDFPGFHLSCYGGFENLGGWAIFPKRLPAPGGRDCAPGANHANACIRMIGPGERRPPQPCSIPNHRFRLCR